MKITILTPEFYNYGALLIGGILKDAGYNNVNIQKGFEKEINADIVLFSLHSTIHLIKYKKEIENIKAFKIVGGPVSKTPQLVFNYLPVNAVIVGEGEISTVKLVNSLNKNFNIDNLDHIEGIAYKKDHEIIKTKKNVISPMKRPLPLIPQDISSENIRGANVYIETHRGCPGNCGFCQVPCYFGRDVRSRALDDIILEVKEFLKKGATRIAISGGTGSLYGCNKFRTTNDDEFTELLKSISSLTGPKNLTIPDIRCDMINDNIMKAIKDYTNGWVFFGIESGSNRILKKMKKGIKVDDVRNAVEIARENGLKIAGSFIVGYPEEEEDDFQATVDLADELMLDDYFVSIAEPIPGTSLAKDVNQMSLNENSVFSKSREYQKYGLSIAEERCLNLMLDSYVFRSIPVAMDDKLLKTLIEETKSQGNHIRTVTKMIKDLKET